MFFHYMNAHYSELPFFYNFPPQQFLPFPQNFESASETKSSIFNPIKVEANTQQSHESPVPSKESQKLNLSSSKKEKEKKVNKSAQENEEYLPEKEGQSEKKKGKQNVLRNILPNIMHQAFTFVQKKSRSGNLVGKLLKEHSTEVGKVDRFYLYQTLIKQKNNNYINEEALIHYCRLHEPECELFGEEEQKVYLKISRILVKYFIDNEVRINILTSSRMKNETKNGHLKVLRRVEKRLSEIYRE